MAKGFQEERYRNLIALLVQQRHQLGLSQAAVATLLRTHQQFVSRYETGERRLDVVEFCDVAKHLQLDCVKLLQKMIEET